MVGQIYPTELQLNRANSFDNEVTFFDLDLSITNGIVSSKLYDKWADFNFEIVHLHFLVNMFLAPLLIVYRSVRVHICFNVNDFTKKNDCIVKTRLSIS